MSARVRRPRSGDFIVSRDPGAPESLRISQYPHPPQLQCSVAEHADRIVRSFAQRTDVDAWFTADRQTYRAIVQHRNGQDPPHAGPDLEAPRELPEHHQQHP